MLLLLILVLAFLIYKWSVAGFDYFDKIGVPYEKPLPIFGNMLDIVIQRRPMIEVTQKSYEMFKNSR